MKKNNNTVQDCRALFKTLGIISILCTSFGSPAWAGGGSSKEKAPETQKTQPPRRVTARPITPESPDTQRARAVKSGLESPMTPRQDVLFAAVGRTPTKQKAEETLGKIVSAFSSFVRDGDETTYTFASGRLNTDLVHGVYFTVGLKDPLAYNPQSLFECVLYTGNLSAEKRRSLDEDMKQLASAKGRTEGLTEDMRATLLTTRLLANYDGLGDYGGGFGAEGFNEKIKGVLLLLNNLFNVLEETNSPSPAEGGAEASADAGGRFGDMKSTLRQVREQLGVLREDAKGIKCRFYEGHHKIPVTKAGGAGAAIEAPTFFRGTITYNAAGQPHTIGLGFDINALWGRLSMLD